MPQKGTLYLQKELASVESSNTRKEGQMSQLQRLCRICDKRFTTEQVIVLFRGYCQGMLKGAEVEEMLGITTRADQCL